MFSQSLITGMFLGCSDPDSFMECLCSTHRSQLPILLIYVFEVLQHTRHIWLGNAMLHFDIHTNIRFQKCALNKRVRSYYQTCLPAFCSELFLASYPCGAARSHPSLPRDPCQGVAAFPCSLFLSHSLALSPQWVFSSFGEVLWFKYILLICRLHVGMKARDTEQYQQLANLFNCINVNQER